MSVGELGMKESENKQHNTHSLLLRQDKERREGMFVFGGKGVPILIFNLALALKSRRMTLSTHDWTHSLLGCPKRLSV